MFDCPDNISIEECLKRQLKNVRLQVTSDDKRNDDHKTTPLFKIISSPRQNSKSFKKSSSTNNESLNSAHTSNIKNISISNFSSGSSSSSSGSGSTSGGGSSGAIFNHGYSQFQNTSNTLKKGVVVQNQTVIVKSNYEMAGRLNQEGKRNSAKILGSHASASLNYMENHGARDLEEDDVLSNIYNENGDRLNVEEFDELKKELSDGIGAFRRTIVDVGHTEIDRDDMNRLIRESLQEFKEKSGKQFEFAYAVHTDTEHIHAHILSYGKSHEINMTKEHLQLFKQTAGVKTEELLQEYKLEQERDLFQNKQIDRSLDPIFDDKDGTKHRNTQSL